MELALTAYVRLEVLENVKLALIIHTQGDVFGTAKLVLILQIYTVNASEP